MTQIPRTTEQRWLHHDLNDVTVALRDAGIWHAQGVSAVTAEKDGLHGCRVSAETTARLEEALQVIAEAKLSPTDEESYKRPEDRKPAA